MERANLISAGHDQSASWPQEVEQQLKILAPFSGRPAAFLLADHHAACSASRALSRRFSIQLNDYRLMPVGLLRIHLDLAKFYRTAGSRSRRHWPFMLLIRLTSFALD